VFYGNGGNWNVQNIKYKIRSENRNHQRMKQIKIVGVPEHFNLPWHLSIQNNEFETFGIDLQWTDVPEGTGKMCQMLRDGSADIAVILTEGIVKDIVSGSPSKIVQMYVESPLIWGIHVSANSEYQTIADLENTKVAISRYGSGSQLMAYVNAQNQGWKTDHLEFEIVNTIGGAVEALTNEKADYFMWERFMTKPLVDKGVFRRVADCPTPWPCFVIAVRNEILEQEPNTITQILNVINNATLTFKQIPDIDSILASKYHQKIEDIQEWLHLTKWSQKPLSNEMLNKIQNQLFELKIIDKKGTFADIVKVI
jgi:ABC-type nitrate/sulfonate/bicarbonate transport system substrate-binding protein